jgi:hypothetical protein
MDETLKADWDVLMKRMEMQFGEGIEIEGILLLIGTQELGKGYVKFSKDEKIDVLHVALCTLLEPHGFYKFTGKDADGWPHWEAVMALPSLKVGEQSALVKRAIIDYFKKIDA